MACTTGRRPYRARERSRRRPRTAAAVEVRMLRRGSQFDPALTERFVALLNEGAAPQPDPNTSA